ncbi:MAG: DUF3526 domain-containing protein [Bacteroidota bacterium]
MYTLLIKQFVLSKTVLFSFLLLFTIGLISILIGKQFLIKQEKTIEAVTEQQEQHIARNVSFHQNDLGLLLYYVRFALINTPERLSALSIGQRDVNPSIQSVTIRNLEGQKYDTDLNNPSNLQAGNLDFGFVIIYLYPLLIIALTFNLLSEEVEKGTWRLVAIQSVSKGLFLVKKLSIRALLTYISFFILFLLAAFIVAIPLTEALVVFFLLSLLYLTFWFVLSFWIISFQQSSSFNALALLALWVFLAIMLPAGVNNFLANKYPVPEALSTMVQQRDGYHKKWDMEKEGTMNKFYAHYPQFKKYTLPHQGFSWLWYYAMQQMGDDEALEQSIAMSEKIRQREKVSRWVAWAVPTMHTQLQFNDIAQTSLQNYIRFLNKTNEFHEKIRLYFYPKIFENAPVLDEDWKSFTPEYVRGEYSISWLHVFAPLILIISPILVFSIYNIRRI